MSLIQIMFKLEYDVATAISSGQIEFAGALLIVLGEVYKRIMEDRDNGLPLVKN